MSRFHSYINSAKEILQVYTGGEPFASFVKKFFSLHKKYGSKDRKAIGHLCYCFFRMGKMNNEMPVEEKLLMGLFLCSNQPDEMLEELRPEWNDKAHLPVAEKCSMINVPYSILNVFPWKDELSNGIDHEKFCESFFIQPDVFLRLRPGHEETVKRKLSDAATRFQIISGNCLALPNSSGIDSIIELNREAVVQDYNSQRTGEFLSIVRPGQPVPILRESDKVWDCCAASGGKSIMLYDLYPGIDLVVSDIRESIIVNLKKRFAEAGISNYKSRVIDLAHSPLPISHSPFNLIIADVPCTGSGTWARTPEQLYYFEKQKINEYASLQKKIISNVIPHLKQDGFLFYITCSVFKKENEEAIAFMERKFPLRVIKTELLKGYDKRADTLFAALLKSSL